jgi:hypothetical protein
MVKPVHKDKDYYDLVKVVSDGKSPFNSKVTDRTYHRVSIKPYSDPFPLLRDVYDGKARTYSKPPHDGGYGPPAKDHGDGDGLSDNHAHEVMLQENQFPEDQHHKSYANQVAMDWRRGGGKKQACGYGGYYSTAHPEVRKGPANKADGADCDQSPFSSAHRRGAGEGF